MLGMYRQPRFRCRSRGGTSSMQADDWETSRCSWCCESTLCPTICNEEQNVVVWDIAANFCFSSLQQGALLWRRNSGGLHKRESGERALPASRASTKDRRHF
jgi:hypothetical protein